MFNALIIASHDALAPQMIWTHKGDEWTGKRGKLAVAMVIKEWDGWAVYGVEFGSDRPGSLIALVPTREEAMARAEADIK